MRILYVEDEPFLSKIVKESLESRGFEVCLVEDGSRVMAAFDDLIPDICVLDVMLPHRDGFEIGKEIRERYPKLPIIFVTAKQQTTDVVQGFESGGNDYLRKPFSVEELIVRMQNLVSLSKGRVMDLEDSAVIKIGQFQFEPLKQVLRHGSTERHLSHREAEILSLLVQNRQETVHRKAILDQVWGNDSFFNSRNLDVYIAHLREYLREDAHVQIITLKGVGYRLV